MTTTKEAIDIRISYYFPIQLIALGTGLILGSLLLIQQSNYPLAVTFLLSGMIFVTANQRLQINRKTNTLREYVWILGVKIGKTKPFATPTNIVVNPTKQGIAFGNLDTNRMHITQKRVAGYLKFEENESIYLGEANN